MRFSRLITFCAVALASLALSMAASAQLNSVQVRSADHPGFSRVVFDFRSGIIYDARVDNNQLVVTFDREFQPAFSTLRGAPLVGIRNPQITRLGGQLTISFDISGDVTLRHFSDGTRIVLDMVIDGPLAAETPIPTDSAGDGPEITEPELTPEDPVEEERSGADGSASNQDDVTPSEADTPPEGNDELPTFEREVAEPDPTLTGIPLPIEVRAGPDSYEMNFPWPYAVSSAVFKRAGRLWVIFDAEARLGFDQIAANIGEWISFGVQQRGRDRLTVAVFGLAENVSLYVSRDGNRWRVRLTRKNIEPESPLVLARQDTVGGGTRLFVPFNQPSPKVLLSDTLVGDELTIVPLNEAGAGLPATRHFAEFHVLESAQGLVISALSDDVVVTRYANGIAIHSINSLALRGPQLDARFGVEGAGYPQGAVNIIDFPTWAQGGIEDFIKNEQRLMREVSVAGEEFINPRRWDLARFYIAHSMANEALAVMEVMVRDNEDFSTDAAFRIVRGIAAYKLGRIEEAAGDLFMRELEAEPDAWLWRSRVLVAQGNFADALPTFEQGQKALPRYNQYYQADFRLDMLETAVEISDPETATWQIGQIRRIDMTRRQTARANYLEGRFREMMEAPEEADALLAAVDDIAFTEIGASARYAKVKIDQAREAIEVTAAIEELERLKLIWRGGNLELDILTDLGELYSDSGNYRRSLEVYRQTITAFPNHQDAPRVAARLSDKFRALFLEGVADQLPEITALALYYDFRELTPLGAEGDQMIRMLSDRLMVVDLLDQAAELLDHQVRFRLLGTAQAVIATRLAKIHLLNRNPDAALEIIRLTRQPDLPDDVMNQRWLVEARALTETGRHEEAEVLIATATGDEVLPLLADIYWGWGQWGKLAETSDRLLGPKWVDGGTLDDDERLLLIRQAIARSMIGDAEPLAVLRSRYRVMMQGGRFANAFDMITNPEVSTNDEIREVVRQIAAVDDLQTFMINYRAEFPNGDTGGGL